MLLEDQELLKPGKLPEACGKPDSGGSQKAQYPLTKEYALHDLGIQNIICGMFHNYQSCGHIQNRGALGTLGCKVQLELLNERSHKAHAERSYRIFVKRRKSLQFGRCVWLSTSFWARKSHYQSLRRNSTSWVSNGVQAL